MSSDTDPNDHSFDKKFMALHGLKFCPDCDGDGYQEMFNDDQSDVITWLCNTCNGSGRVKL